MTDTHSAIAATLHFDGVPNPGHAGGGFILRIGNDAPIERRLDFGDGTNNVAEYLSLIAGLKESLARNVTDLTVFGDSQLVIRGVARMRPSPKGKPHLERLKAQAIELAKRFR